MHLLSDEDGEGAHGYHRSDEMVRLHSIRVVVDLSCHDALDSRNLQTMLVHVHATTTSNHQDHHITMKVVVVADLLVHDYNHDEDDEIGDGRGEEEDGAAPKSKAAGMHFQAVALIRMVDMMDGAR